MLRRLLAGAVLVLLACGGSGCASVRSFVPGLGGAPSKLKAAEVPEAIERAEVDVAQGRAKRALAWMRAAQKATGIDRATRTRVQQVYESAARARLDELSGPESRPEDLDDLLDLELPRQIAVTAAVRAAQRYLDRDDPLEAYRLIKKLDEKFPSHHERSAAGRIVAAAGFAREADRSRYLFLFPRRERAKEMFEYLVLNYPSDSSCDRAYVTLARMYQEEGRWQLAIERLQDLLLYHPNSPWAVVSEAHVPHLRLVSIESPEYDRGELLLTRTELETWVRRHEGHPIENEVRLDLAECRLRLFESDMDIAGFYREVKNETGARQHARRAEEEAGLAGDAARVEEARAFLASLPPEDYESVADRLEGKTVDPSAREADLEEAFRDRGDQ